jgi:hypothetical protein
MSAESQSIHQNEDGLFEADAMLAMLQERLCAAAWPDFTENEQYGLACTFRAIRRAIGQGIKEHEALHERVATLTGGKPA